MDRTTDAGKPKVTRFEAGRYLVAYRGRNFDVRSMFWNTEGESTEDAWVLLDADAIANGHEGYCNHYWRKWQALEAVVAIVEAERTVRK